MPQPAFLRLLRSLLLPCALVLVGAGCPERQRDRSGGPAEPRFSVHLVEVGADPAAVIAAVASVRGGSEVLARKLIERKDDRSSLPIRTDIAEEEARAAAATLERAGARAQVVPIP